MKKLLLMLLVVCAAMLSAETFRFCIFSDPQPSRPGEGQKAYSPYWYARKAMEKAKSMGLTTEAVAKVLSTMNLQPCS